MIVTKQGLSEGGIIDDIQDIAQNRGREFLEEQWSTWFGNDDKPTGNGIPNSTNGGIDPSGTAPNRNRLPANYFETGTYNLPSNGSNSNSAVMLNSSETITYAKPKTLDIYFEKRSLDTRDFDCNSLDTLSSEQLKWLERNPLVYQKIQAMCTDRIVTPANLWFGINPIWYLLVGALVLGYIVLPKNNNKE